MNKVYGLYVVFCILILYFYLCLVLSHGNTASTFHLKIQISDGFFESIVWASVNTIKPICCETFKIPA